MNRTKKLSELAARAKKRRLELSAPKPAEDVRIENESFALFEEHLYQEIVKGDSSCS